MFRAMGDGSLYIQGPPTPKEGPLEIERFERQLPSMIERYERQLVQWLYSSEPTEESFPPERAPGPLLSSQPTAPSTSTSHDVEPVNMGTVTVTEVTRNISSSGYTVPPTGQLPHSQRSTIPGSACRPQPSNVCVEHPNRSCTTAAIDPAACIAASSTAA